MVKSDGVKNNACSIMLCWVIYVPRWQQYCYLAVKIVLAYIQILEMSSCCKTNRYSVILKIQMMSCLMRTISYSFEYKNKYKQPQFGKDDLNTIQVLWSQVRK